MAKQLSLHHSSTFTSYSPHQVEERLECDKVDSAKASRFRLEPGYQPVLDLTGACRFDREPDAAAAMHCYNRTRLHTFIKHCVMASPVPCSRSRYVYSNARFRHVHVQAVNRAISNRIRVPGPMQLSRASLVV